MNVDFHIHTNNSDGSYTCDEIINKCLKENIKYIAITDHNTFTSCNNLPKGIKAINGMEIDVRYNGYVFHMLLYNFAENKEILNNYFKRSRRHEIYRFHKYINLIEETFNLNIDKKFIRDFIKRNSYFDTIRMNRLLVEYNICKKPKEAYLKYTHILPANRRYRINIDEFVKIANETNGIMSLAHPLKYNINIEDMKNIILELKDKYHLQVIEAINNHQTKEEEKELISFCKKNNLLISAGSDSHYQIGERSNKRIGIVLDSKLNIEDVTFLKLVNYK